LGYRLLRQGLEAGNVYCRDSVRYRSFEDDLMDDQTWQDKDNLITSLGLPLLKQPIREHLAELEQQLERWGCVPEVPALKCPLDSYSRF
jgi:hypothetical protein